MMKDSDKKDWLPIPKYEGLYWINKNTKEVCNMDGHVIRTYDSKFGNKVELRKYGQRECILVEELLEKTLKGDMNETEQHI